MNAELIRQRPQSVSMICEGETGYHNIDLTACKEKGTMVCNTPAFPTKRVAHIKRRSSILYHGQRGIDAIYGMARIGNQTTMIAPGRRNDTIVYGWYCHPCRIQENEYDDHCFDTDLDKNVKK